MSSKKIPALRLRHYFWIGLIAIGHGTCVSECSWAEEPNGLTAALAIEQAMTKAIERAEKSVVAIARVKRDAQDTGLPRFEVVPRFGQPQLGQSIPDPASPDFVPSEFATGVVIDERGLILTTAHAVTDNETHRYFVTTVERKTFAAQIKASDAKSDLAVLEILPSEANATDARRPKFAPITFGDVRSLKKGQIVVTLGNPYGIAYDGQPSASWGIISNLSRRLIRKPADEGPAANSLHQMGTLIQTDAKLNFGTSGGPLLNLHGEMIGLTTSLAARSGFEQAAGFAIPLDDAFKQIIEVLKQGREVAYGFLGVIPVSLTAHEVLNGAVGARLQQVSGGTPAARAGLETFDIVTKINDQPIFDADGLRLAVGRLRPGQTAQIAVVQGAGNQVMRTAVLTKGPNLCQRLVTTQEPNWRGIQIDDSTAFVPALVGLDDRRIAVADVRPNSPAARAGIHPRMVILRIDDQEVQSCEDFWRLVANRAGDVELLIRTERFVDRLTIAAE